MNYRLTTYVFRCLCLVYMYVSSIGDTCKYFEMFTTNTYIYYVLVLRAEAGEWEVAHRHRYRYIYSACRVEQKHFQV